VRYNSVADSTGLSPFV